VGTDSLSGALRARRAKGVQAAGVTALVIVALRFVPLTSQLSVFSLIENSAYDKYFDLRPRQDMSRFVIVAIDEPGLRALGRFPWDRSAHARLLEHLAEAKVVAFDVLFAEPEAHDAELAQAMRRHGRVVLAAHKRRAAGGVNAAPTWAGYGQLPPGRLPRCPATEEFVAPVPALAQAAAGIGYADIEPDTDGIYRRVKPLQVGAGGDVYPHFGTEVARVAAGVAPDRLVASAVAGTVDTGQHPVPLRHGSALVNYGGPNGTVRRVSFAQVLAGELPAETFRDKIVLVGATAAALYDVRPAPFRTGSRIFFGVETNANVAHTLLEAVPLRDARVLWPWGVYALLVGGFVGWAIWHSREWLAATIGVGTLALLALPVFWVGVAYLHQVVPYGAIVWAVAVPMAMALYERLGVEKREIQHQFATYVSPDVLHELAHSPELVRRGQRRTVTLLFSDIRGSTTLCEQIEPDVWIAQLNEYLSEMSEAIFNYHGYLDKFLGDGIMAVWDAFGNQPDHAELALKAALQMQARLAQLNQEWAQRGDRVPLRVGIGLHTGEAIVGNVGSDRRAQFTAIGDTVNAAARIESLTKERGVPLLLSETTAKLVAGRIGLVELGSAELRGREQPLRIYTPGDLTEGEGQHVP
jgi:adenylate cyclase